MASTINALWRSATAADDAGQFCSANCAALAATKHIPAHVWQQLMQEGISKVMAAVLGRGLSLLLECDTGVNSRTAQQCTYDALLGATKQILTPMFEVQTHLSSQGLSKRDFNAGMQSCAEFVSILPTACDHFNKQLPKLVQQAGVLQPPLPPPLPPQQQKQKQQQQKRQPPQVEGTATTAATPALQPHERLCLIAKLASELLRLWLIFQAYPCPQSPKPSQRSPQQQARATSELYTMTALCATMLSSTHPLQAVAAACSTGSLQSPGLWAINSDPESCIKQSVRSVVSNMPMMIASIYREETALQAATRSSLLAAIPQLPYLLAVHLALFTWAMHDEAGGRICTQALVEHNSSSAGSSSSSRSNRGSNSSGRGRTGGSNGGSSNSSRTAAGGPPAGGNHSSSVTDCGAAGSIPIPAYHQAFLSSCGLASVPVSSLELMYGHDIGHSRQLAIRETLLTRIADLALLGGYSAQFSSGGTGDGGSSSGSSSSSSSGSSSSSKLGPGQVWLVSAMVAELSALMPSTAVLSKSFNALMALDSVAIPTAARMAAIASRTASYNNTAAAAAAGTHAGILECSLLSLVVQLLLPAVQVVLADGATGQGGGSTAGFAEQFITRSVHILMRCAVSEDPKDITAAIFKSSTFEQQPTATLSAIEAAIRYDNTPPSSSTQQGPRAAASSTGPDAGLQRLPAIQRILPGMMADLRRQDSALSAFAAAGPSQSAAVLSLLASCLKFYSAQLVEVQPLQPEVPDPQPGASPSSRSTADLDLEGALQAFCDTNLAYDAAVHMCRAVSHSNAPPAGQQRRAASVSTPVASAAAGEPSSRCDWQQRVLCSCLALAGKALHTAGKAWHVALGKVGNAADPQGVLRNINMPQQVAALAEAGMLLTGLRSSMVAQNWDLVILGNELGTVLQQLPASCHPGWTSAQLQELHQSYSAALGTAMSVAVPLPGQVLSPAAEAACKVGVQLAGECVRLGGALCAALPSKSFCNDPECYVFDKASEQQLVSGKGTACGGCKMARYCCRAHQVRHWPDHKAACKALAKIAKKEDKGS